MKNRKRDAKRKARWLKIFNCAFITSYERDDETNLDYAKARYYNYQHGRFMAIDPLLRSGKPTNPQTFNRYTYVLNNPLVFIDPSGEIPVYYKTLADGTRRFSTQKFKGSSLYEGETVKVYGRYNGNKQAGWYWVTSDGIYSVGRGSNRSSGGSTQDGRVAALANGFDEGLRRQPGRFIAGAFGAGAVIAAVAAAPTVTTGGGAVLAAGAGRPPGMRILVAPRMAQP